MVNFIPALSLPNDLPFFTDMRCKSYCQFPRIEIRQSKPGQFLQHSLLRRGKVLARQNIYLFLMTIAIASARNLAHDMRNIEHFYRIKLIAITRFFVINEHNVCMLS
jgi:hypothetical protein